METVNKQPEITILQKNLVTLLIKNKFINSKKIEKAFLTVPRHLFLPGVDLEKVYSDVPIVTKWQGKIPVSSSTQPAAIATMLKQLKLKDGLNILEIGAGTGFNAALMAQIVGKKGQVITVDIDKDVTSAARKNLDIAGYPHVKVICKDGVTCYKPEAPYDRIILTVAGWDIAPEWLKQLKQGGILLLPMYIRTEQVTIAFKRVGDHLESISTSSCRFMVLRGDNSRPADYIKFGISKDILFGSYYKISLKKNKIDSSLNKPYKDFATSIKISMREIKNGLLPWLDIIASNFFRAATSGDISKKMKMPALFESPGKFGNWYPGLIDKDSICLIINPAGEKVKTGKSKEMESVELFIRNFGKSETLAKQLINLISEWDHAGRPTLENITAKAYFNKSKIIPAKNEFMIQKKQFKLLYSWK